MAMELRWVLDGVASFVHCWMVDGTNNIVLTLCRSYSCSLLFNTKINAPTAQLKEARHPCVELQENVEFIPNDISLVFGDSSFLLVTGPNMGGQVHIHSFTRCHCHHGTDWFVRTVQLGQDQPGPSHPGPRRGRRCTRQRNFHIHGRNARGLVHP